MLYFKIFSSWLFLFVYFNIKIILSVIVSLVIVYSLLIDSSVTYRNIENNDHIIKNVINKTYIENDDDSFIFDISNKNKQRLQFFVNEELNKNFQLSHLENYQINFINEKEKYIFEIEFINPNTNIFVNNIYNSKLNSNQSKIEKEVYINYLVDENKNNISFNNFFYELLKVMTNKKEIKKISNLLNNMNKENILCKKHDILINVSNNNGRISVICK